MAQIHPIREPIIGVSFGQDALSSHTFSKSNETNNQTYSHSSASSDNDSFTTPPKENAHKKGNRRLSILNPFTWFQNESIAVDIGVLAIPDDSKNDEVREILEYFRSFKVEAMEEILKHEKNKRYTEKDEEVYGFIDDNAIPSEYCEINTFVDRKPKPFPNRLVKAVRFQMDYTPEERPKRSFTPLITSTPRLIESSSKQFEYLDVEKELHVKDTDPHVSHDLSSILMRNDSIMSNLNKSRQQAVELALDNDRWKDQYRICYDDTDEEEVEDESIVIEASLNLPSASHQSNGTCGQTYVIEHDLDDSMTAFSPHPHERETFVKVDPNMSLDSSIHMGIDRIEDYLKRLEIEVDVARESPRRDVWQRIGFLESQIKRISSSIDGIKQRFVSRLPNASSDYGDAYGDASYRIPMQGQVQNSSEVFDNSNWAQEHESLQLSRCGSLISMNNWIPDESGFL